MWNPRCQADGGRVVSGISLDGAVSVHELIRQLPEISIVRDRSRAMAVLDAIMSPDSWGESPGVRSRDCETPSVVAVRQRVHRTFVDLSVEGGWPASL
ncbi:hypothetical protein FNV62_00410 [Streptomyces sp. RLB3-17]|nr:hypothetical protein FNV67_02060 [Streptomyces sp. S1D4-20]QDN64559.1 hypothetical protein FNV66_01695 [Streptomyces sp. S1D4-14]QDN74880.1 hypothetical protein FNV64_03580 [Streptomyces sp. S1A1-7]QDN95073.1 hypothetical protein FNV58_01830 [Streptomyces sp. RLB1-9]QDO16797.1 hypothetical protein FNV65_00400 [Streptomyces sp. S1A1-8]QDO26920.1 hypothetical protein FNV63_00395 [Streptomyces sp. S1A1-3]QDO36960.1 hypothetical protein FNV62_00410 [Streptomyces sp. RLB3-17]QDO55524.1 hypothe